MDLEDHTSQIFFETKALALVKIQPIDLPEAIPVMMHQLLSMVYQLDLLNCNPQILLILVLKNIQRFLW